MTKLTRRYLIALSVTTVVIVAVAGFSLYTKPVKTPFVDEGIVSLAYDDGWISHYTHAIPDLKAANMKGTFYIISQHLGAPYMTSNQILTVQAEGHEIGAHTRNHLDLKTLSESAAHDEIDGSRSDLLALGATPVETLAYPFGSYNTTVQNITKNAGFIAARSIDRGTNTKSTDKFALKVQTVVADTTLDQVKQWIDEAAVTHTWLILLFHQIDEKVVPGNQDLAFGTTPEIHKEIIKYLQNSNVAVKPIKDVIPLLNP